MTCIDRFKNRYEVDSFYQNSFLPLKKCDSFAFKELKKSYPFFIKAALTIAKIASAAFLFFVLEISALTRILKKKPILSAKEHNKKQLDELRRIEKAIKKEDVEISGLDTTVIIERYKNNGYKELYTCEITRENIEEKQAEITQKIQEHTAEQKKVHLFSSGIINKKSSAITVSLYVKQPAGAE